jgi:uncharacterized protein (TIGR03086 family)
MDIVDLWSRAADGFAARLDAVADDQWDDPTPCTDWNVRELIDHAINSQRLLPGRLGAELPEADEEPKAAWRKIRAGALAVYEKPGVLDQKVELPFGEMTVRQMLNNIAIGDLLLHSWDLARATGGDERLDPDAVATAYEGLQPFDEMLHASGSVFGRKIDPPPGADTQTQLLCFSGRRP